jgi:tetratricopeptide (TPR) repeat protein
MMPGTPGGRADGPSLVDEIHQQRVRAVVERKRQGRRRVGANIFFGIMLFIGLVAAGVVVKILVDRHRLDSGLSTARSHLATSTPLDFDKAVAQLENNLRIEPAHPPTLGMLALVRVHQVADGLIESDVADEAVQAASDAGRDEAPLAAGILAGIAGDLDEARRAYEAVDADAQPELASPAAWLEGIGALARPYEKELTDAALARVEAALERDPEWVPNLRMAAALLARTGRFDDAVQRIEAARELAPSHVGLSVDEAVYHALTHQHRSGVLEVTEVVLLSAGTPPRDAGYARLARGIALIDEGEDVEGIEQLEACWATLPKWDNHGRDLVLDALLSAGEVKKSKALLEELQLGSQADAVFAAWQQLLDGDVKRALENLAELPQDLPRVAHLQALALVEQKRWDEAQRWVEFASEALPHRPDLAVASARLLAQRKDASAIEKLEELAKEHPHAYRVWTGLAEAHATVEEPSKSAIKAKLEAIERATKDEPQPSIAWHLLALHHRQRAEKTPKAALEAIEAYRKATEIAPEDASYSAELGLYLAGLGQWAPAEAELRRTIELEPVGHEPFLTLARTVIDRAQFRRGQVPAEVETWLAEAGKRGGDPWALELEWARLQLVRGTPESLAQAQLRAQRLMDHDADHPQARAIFVVSLVQQGQLDVARKVVQRNLAKFGELMLAMGRIELADGNERAGARWANRGWERLVKAKVPVSDLLLAAPFVTQTWLREDEPRLALQVVKELTVAAPMSGDAWVLQGETQKRTELEAAACASASKAVEVDEKLPTAHALLGDCFVWKGEMGKAKAAYASAADHAKGTVDESAYRRRAQRL